MFFTHDSSSTNHRVFLKVGSKHPNYSDESAPPCQIHNLGTLQIIALVVLLLTTALIVHCTLLKHPTSPALLTSPTPRQRAIICGACTGTAQVGVSLAATNSYQRQRVRLPVAKGRRPFEHTSYKRIPAAHTSDFAL